MNTSRSSLLFGALLMVAAVLLLVWQHAAWRSLPSLSQTSEPETVASPAPTSEPTAEPTPAEPSPSPEPTPAPAYYYPVAGYHDRLTVRVYGTEVTAADREGLPCGAAYEGFHNADDIEARSDEFETPLSVHAIAAGTVRQVGAVNGYGGLIVIEHILNGQPYTAYYGHVDLDTVPFGVDNRVHAGERIANLGGHCGPDSGNERMHLHFGLRPGTDIDVRGYAPSRAVLSQWINPKELLESLGAAMPGL